MTKVTPWTKPESRVMGMTNIRGTDRIETKALVERIRKFRGRLTFSQIVHELNWPDGRMSWLRVRQLCVRYEITTADADEPEYYTRAIREDNRKLQCEGPGCKALAKKKGLCDAHYSQLWRTGAVGRLRHVTSPSTIPPLELARANLRTEITKARSEPAKPFKKGDLIW